MAGRQVPATSQALRARPAFPLPYTVQIIKRGDASTRPYAAAAFSSIPSKAVKSCGIPDITFITRER